MNSNIPKGLLVLLLSISMWSCEEDIDDVVNTGIEMYLRPAFSLHEDDTMDKYIPSSLASSNWEGGYATILFPLVKSLDVTPCLSMEGKRVGFTESSPTLNENGQIVKHLQDQYHWEIMAHTMTAPYVRESYLVDSLNSPLANKILQEGSYVGGAASMSTTTVFEASTNKNYMVNANKNAWIPLPDEWIRPYVKNYNTKKVTKYNPTFPIEYQWGTFLKYAQLFGFNINSGVIPAVTGSHACVPQIKKILPNIFEVVEGVTYNTIPLTSTVHRISLEGSSETSTNNLYNERQLKEWKKLVDKAVANHGWIIFYMHAYRHVWKNCIEEELVSNGGTYPDEWVHPILPEDGIEESFATPPTRLGISTWNEWYPCPGTRLRMVYDLLLYMKEKGLDNLTSGEGFERFGNKLEEGLYTKGGQIGQDRSWIEGTQSNYSYHVIGVNGRELRYPKQQ